MKTIAIINEKGGVSKTTTAINMAQILSKEHGFNILFIDADKQGNASQHLGVYTEGKCAMADVLKGEYMSTEIKKSQYGIDVIDANITLKQAIHDLEHGSSAQYGRIKEFVETVNNAFIGISKGYDFTIIDCPPDVGICAVNAICAADDIIIPIKLDAYAIEGADMLVKQIRQLRQLNPKVRIAGALITNYEKDRRKPEIQEAAEKWLRKSQLHVFDTKIRHNAKIPDSTIHKQSIIEYAPHSGAARDYRAFVKEYLKEKKRKKG